MTTPVNIHTEGLDPIHIPENSPPYRVAQLRLKRDSYLRRMPVARSGDMKYLLFRVIALNDLIELGVADVHEVLRKWRKVYSKHTLNAIFEDWILLEAYANTGASHLSHRGKSLDQLFPEGQELVKDEDNGEE